MQTRGQKQAGMLLGQERHHRLAGETNNPAFPFDLFPYDGRVCLLFILHHVLVLLKILHGVLHNKKRLKMGIAPM